MKKILVLLAFTAVVAGVQAQQTNSLEDFQETMRKQEVVLLDGYGKALTEVMSSLKLKGAIESYLVVEAEKKRFDAERTVAFTSDVKVVFYAATDEYRKGRIVLLRKYMLALDGLVKQSMIADKIDDAKEAKEERDRYAFELADLEARMPKPVVKVVEKSVEKAINKALDVSGTWVENNEVWVIKQMGSNVQFRMTKMARDFGEVVFEGTGKIDKREFDSLGHWVKAPILWLKSMPCRYVGSISEEGNVISGKAEWDDKSRVFRLVRRK